MGNQQDNNKWIIQMQLNSQKTCEQSQLSSNKGIQQLKKKTTLSNSQLHGLLSNTEDFNQRIKQLNQKGIKEIQSEMFEEAIIYLGEAEKNLEYVASCGLRLDRSLITTTLKNLACVYQRMWELSTCYDYMQALIYNLSNFFPDSHLLPITEAIRNFDSDEYMECSKIINNKLNIGLCYLQFSALSSQLGKHQEAQKSVEESMRQFKIVSDYCHSYQMISKGKTSILLDQIRECLNFNPNIKVIKGLIDAKKGIESINNHRYFFSFDSKIIENLSMGDIMQISYTTFQQSNKTPAVDWFVSQLGLTYLTIYISCCYFALATQIRLTNQQSYVQEQTNMQMTLAKIHHLHSIKIASQIVLIQSNFLTHIIKSFKNNFSIDLINQNFQEQQQKSQISFIQINKKIQEAQTLQKEKKIEILQKNSEKKSQSDGTKVHTIQSEINSYVDINKTKQQKIKKQISRKTSVVDKSPKLNFKNLKSKNNLNHLQDKKKKQILSSRSSQSRKQFSKQHKKKEKLKKQKLNQQYFLNTKIRKQKKSQDRNLLGSPKNKIKRKPQSSSSRPKLKLKALKSPTKQKQ